MWRRIFYNAACADLERRARSGAVRLREDWRRNLKKSLNARNYYLTEEGITFFLPMYSVSDSTGGIPTFTIPWREGTVPPCPEPNSNL